VAPAVIATGTARSELCRHPFGPGVARPGQDTRHPGGRSDALTGADPLRRSGRSLPRSGATRPARRSTASTRAERPKLRATLATLKPGDTLVIYKPDRIARSMKELLVLLEDQLHAREINLHILTGICAGLHRPSGATIADKMLLMVAAMAHDPNSSPADLADTPSQSRLPHQVITFRHDRKLAKG